MATLACPACGTDGLRSLGRVAGALASRCRKCATVTVEVDGHLDGEYDREYYSESYVPIEQERTAFLHRLLSSLGPARGRVLVDVGCGPGFGLVAARNLGFQTLGIDPSPAAAELCRQRGIPVARGHAEELPLRTGRADVVLLLDVIAHVRDPGQVARSAIRILRPGGTLMIKTPHRPWHVYRLAAWAPDRMARSLLHLPQQRHALSRRGLSLLGRRAGATEVVVARSDEALGWRGVTRGRWRTRARALLESLISVVAGSRSLLATSSHGDAPLGSTQHPDARDGYDETTTPIADPRH